MTEAKVPPQTTHIHTSGSILRQFPTYSEYKVKVHSIVMFAHGHLGSSLLWVPQASLIARRPGLILASWTE
jgi:hypothetical protein